MMDYLKQPVFVIKNVDKNIDFSLPPCSGEEYIQRVIMEAKQCADVVVADMDPSYMKTPVKAYVEPLAGCVQAPATLGPSIEWQEHQIAAFSEMRLYVSRLKNETHMYKRKRKADIHLPDISDENAWIKLCLGNDSENEIKPTLNILFSFNQSIIEPVLEYLTEFVETEKRIEYKIGQWIYTLLVILEQPLQPNMYSCLRSLARSCSVIRADSTVIVI